MRRRAVALRMLVPSAWLLVLSLYGCSSGSRTAHDPNTELPGFDAWLPRGVTVRDVRHPAVGSYEIRSAGALGWTPGFLSDWLPWPSAAVRSVKVSWRAERLSEGDEQDTPRIMEAALSGITRGAGELTSAGNGRWISLYDVPAGQLAVGYVRCEPWLTVTFVAALNGKARGMEAMRAMVGSVRCRIDPQRPASLNIDLDVPPHYGQAVGTDVPTWLSPHGSALITNFTTGDVTRDPAAMDQVLSGIFSAALGTSAPLAISSRPLPREDGGKAMISTLSGEMGELGDRFRIGTLYCPEIDATAMLMVFGAPDPEVDVDALIRSMQCPRADGSTEAHPTINEVFSGLCERGDLDACVGLIELMDAGNAVADERMRAVAADRACDLGRTDHCT